MADTKRLLEFAPNGLHSELVKVNKEITDLEIQIRRLGGTKLRAVLIAKRLSSGNPPGKKSHMTAAGASGVS